MTNLTFATYAVTAGLTGAIMCFMSYRTMAYQKPFSIGSQLLEWRTPIKRITTAICLAISGMTVALMPYIPRIMRFLN